MKLIAVVSNRAKPPRFRLRYGDQFTCQKRTLPFNMAPTISSTVQMIFGDIMTVALMRTNNFTLEQYALNHPAGRIGKSITVKVRDLMIINEKVPCCKANDNFVEILVERSNKRCGCVLVLDEAQKLLGIFTDGDLRRALQLLGPKVLESASSRS